MNHNQGDSGLPKSRDELKTYWDRALESLEKALSSSSHYSMVKQCRLLGWRTDEDHTLILGAPSPFARHWLEAKLAVVITEVLSDVFGMPVDLSIVLDQPESKAQQASPTLPVEPLSSTRNAKKPRRVPATIAPEPLDLNAEYTFENFMVGNSNQLAYAAACAVANHPGEQYNPYFLYAPTGLGKTHLLEAIANHLVQTRPDLRIGYTTGQAFTNAFITAVREHHMDAFREHIRNVDVWLVDDVQFIAGKDATQEEFFHLFNALDHSSKQIVLTCDVQPRAIKDLPPRLQSRFESGLIVDITPPELETRIAILDHNARRQNIVVPADVMHRVASIIEGNVRTLLGVLTSMYARASLFKQQISHEVLDSVLTTHFVNVRNNEPIETRTCAAVARWFGIDQDTLLSNRRDQRTLTARYMAMLILHEHAKLTLSAIGRIFNKDHTTVMNAVQRSRVKLASDPKLQAELIGVLQELRLS